MIALPMGSVPFAVAHFVDVVQRDRVVVRGGSEHSRVGEPGHVGGQYGAVVPGHFDVDGLRNPWRRQRVHDTGMDLEPAHQLVLREKRRAGGDRCRICQAVFRLSEKELRAAVDQQIHALAGLAGHGHDVGAGVHVQHMALGAQPHICELAAGPDTRRHQRAIVLIARRNAYEFSHQSAFRREILDDGPGLRVYIVKEGAVGVVRQNLQRLARAWRRLSQD